MMKRFRSAVAVTIAVFMLLGMCPRTALAAPGGGVPSAESSTGAQHFHEEEGLNEEGTDLSDGSGQDTPDGPEGEGTSDGAGAPSQEDPGDGNAPDPDGNEEPSGEEQTPPAPLAAAPPQKADNLSHTVVLKYRLVNATSYNSAWLLTTNAGIQVPESFELTLLEDGSPIRREGVEPVQTIYRTTSTDRRDESWTVEWSLPVNDGNGDPISYGEFTVATSPSLADGELSARYVQNTGKTIVYSYSNGTKSYNISITTTLYGFDNLYLKKTWVGDGGDSDPYQIRPKDIKYTVLGNGVPVKSGDLTPNSSDQTVYRAYESSTRGVALPQLDENGEPIHYTVEISGVPAYYTYELNQFPFVEGTGHLNRNGGTTLTGIYPSQLYSDVTFTLNSKSVNATFLFEGDGIGTEAELKNRPTSLNVHLEYSTDGGATWQKFWGKYAYDAVEAGDVPNSLKYTWDDLPATDAEGNPVEYRVVQEDLFLYSTSYDPPVDSPDGSSRELVVHNSYNDNWNYKLDLRWRESDPARKYDINEVTVSRDTVYKPVYELNVSVQKHYEPGDMQIRIPYTILTPRFDNQPITPSAFSLGPASNPSPDFTYTYVIEDNGTPNDKSDDTVLFYNYRPLESNDNIIIAVQYDVRPYNVIDCSETTLQATATAVYTDATGNRSEPEQQVSHAITYRMDTGITGLNVSKDNQENIYYWKSEWGEEPDDFDMGSYNYVSYYLNAYITNGNQPLYFELTDMPDSDGEVWRIYDYDISTRPLVESELTENGYCWTTGIKTSKTSSCRYFVIVRYPRQARPDPTHDGQYTYEDDYMNTLNVRAVCTDEHEGDKESNDKNDILTGEATAFDHWVDYEFIYTGEIYATRKTMNSGTFFLDPLYYSSDVDSGAYLEMTVNGYNYSNGYRLDVYDDAVYARPKIDGTLMPYVRLGAEDYYLYGKSATVTVYLTQIDRTNGQESYAGMPGEGLTVWGSRTMEGDWEQIPVTVDSVSEQYKYIQYKLDNFSDKGYVQIKFSLPEGLKDRTRIYTSGIGVSLRGTSSLVQSWLEAGEDVQIHLENFAAYELFVGDADGNYSWANPLSESSNTLAASLGLDEEDLNSRGAYRHRKNAGWDLKSATQSTVPTKVTWTQSPDPTTQSYSIQYRLSCVDRYNITNLPEEVYEAWCHESGVFFDLLPEGFHFDSTKEVTVYGAHTIHTGSAYGRVETLTLPSGIRGQGKAVLESVETIDDYKGTGRQLVIFRVKSLMPEGQNYGKDGSATYTGFAVDFYCVAAYDDIPAGELFNYMCYQRTDGDLIAQGITDEKAKGRQGYYFPDAPVGDDGKDSFYDINGDGRTDIPDSAFNFSRVTPDFIRSLENMLNKKVRASGDGFVLKDVADLGSEYTYRLTMSGSPGGITKDVVFYDILENAANTEGHTGESWWKGSFERVDVSSAQKEGINVKVYYATAAGLSYNAPETLLLDQAPEGTWSETCPEDPSLVTAVAFDLRYGTDGSPQEFAEDDTVKVDIIMKAPDEIQPAELAFNRPAYESSFVPKNSPTEIYSFNIGSRVEVSLRDLQDILIRKAGPSIDDPDTIVPLGGAVFTLYKCTSDQQGHTHSSGVSSGSCWKKVMSGTTLIDGTVKFEDLDTGTYRLCETTGPSGYNTYGTSKWWVFEVDASRGYISEPTAYKSSGDLVELSGDKENGYTLIDVLETIQLQVRKTWAGKEFNSTSIPRKVSFRIYRSKGADAEKELYTTIEVNTASSSSTGSKTISVPRYYQTGCPYIYTVEEVDIPGFTWEITSQQNAITNSSYSFTFRNTQVNPEVNVTKLWSNADGTDDSPEGAQVTFRLYRDGNRTDYTVTLDGTADETKPSTPGGWEAEPWKAQFVNLAEYRFVLNSSTGYYDPVKIVYTVREESSTGGYAPEEDTAAADGSITNIQEETSVSVKKQWRSLDGSQEAPEGAEVTFTLLADGEETDHTLTLDGEADSASPEVTGGWEKEAWTAEFVHLPRYALVDGETVEIVYSVKETSPWAGYSAEEDTAAGGETILNVQEETEVTFEKKWKNADGTAAAPEGAEVTFTLLSDGAETDYTVTLDGEADSAPTAPGGYEKEAWKALFAHLVKYRLENGRAVEIVYSVKETASYPGYAPENDTADASGSITNLQQETEVSFEKKWKNADGTATAPEGAEVTFTLLSDGEETGYTVTLDGTPDGSSPEVTGGWEKEAWKAAFLHLPKFVITSDGAAEIQYTVKETSSCPGYEAEKDTAEASGSITNLQQETEISVHKEWHNANGTDEAPEGASIELTLLADGQETGYTVILDGTADTEPVATGGYEKQAWSACFLHLPAFKNENGKAVRIVYTVKETGAYPGYGTDEDTASSGGTILNTETETEVCAFKQWKNADGTLSPPKGAKVVFVLLSDGEETEYTVTLDGTADEDDVPDSTGGYEPEEWKAQFVHLPKYRTDEDGNAVEIEYTVKESEGYSGYLIDGKDTVSDGGTITNRQKGEGPETGFYTGHALRMVLLLVSAEALVLLSVKAYSRRKRRSHNA